MEKKDPERYQWIKGKEYGVQKSSVSGMQNGLTK